MGCSARSSPGCCRLGATNVTSAEILFVDIRITARGFARLRMPTLAQPGPANDRFPFTGGPLFGLPRRSVTGQEEPFQARTLSDRVGVESGPSRLGARKAR